MTPAEVLETSRLSTKNVFLLGCFEGRVTLFAQQIRALNLVDAILTTPGLLPEKGAVAIVGGGAAGMTAAVALAEHARKLTTIDLYERNDRLMHLQDGSPRYLHPHLYDWPDKDATQSDAGLPFLNWREHTAGEVAKKIQQEFYARRSFSQIRPKLLRDVIQVAPTNAGRWHVAVRDPPRDGGDYDAVILSIGFGYERSIGSGIPSFWKESKFAGAFPTSKPQHRVFLSGNGDGGLVDFIMAAYGDGQSVISHISSQDLGKVSATLLEIERQAWKEKNKGSFDIFREYKERLPGLLAHSLKMYVKNELRNNVEIQFHTREKFLFRSTTAILNRFAAFLAIMIDGEAERPRIKVLHGSKPRVLWAAAALCIGWKIYKFDDCVLRFGPDREKNLQPFSDLGLPRIEKARPATPSLTASAAKRFARNLPSRNRSSSNPNAQNAEHLPKELLASFFNDVKPSPNNGTDFYCKGLRDGRAFSALYGHPEPEFIVAFILGSLGISSLRREDYRRLMKLSPEKPVMILCRDTEFGKTTTHFSSLHNWLRSEPGAAAKSSSGSIPIRLKPAFQELNQYSIEFHFALITEALLSRGHQTLVWTPRRSNGLYALTDEEIFYEDLEVASWSELPASIRQEFHRDYHRYRAFFDWYRDATAKPPSQELMDELLEKPETRRWIKPLLRGLKRRNKGASPNNPQHQFVDFVEVVNRHQKGQLPSLPEFTAEHVRPWRLFVDMYPRSVEMLRDVVEFSRYPNDITFASALLPVIALSCGGTLHEQAHGALMKKLRDRENEFARDYRFRRESYRGPAEAGSDWHLKKLLALISRPENKPNEFNYLDSYGWIKSVRHRYITGKLNFPTERDRNLQPLYVRMDEVCGAD